MSLYSNHFFPVLINSAVMQARLRKMPSPSLFGADIHELALHAEMQTNNRLRLKVDTDATAPTLLSLAAATPKVTVTLTQTHFWLQ